MGVNLIDIGDADRDFSINWWHWRAIVEAVRRTGALSPERVDGLHIAFVGELNTAEARAVGRAIRSQVSPTMGEGERLLLDGALSTSPDDGVLHRESGEVDRNYGTDRATLEAFAAFCESCKGFRVL